MAALPRFGQGRHDRGVAVLVKRIADAAGHHPAWVDAFAAQQFDDLLAELAQGDTVFGQVRVLLRHAEDVAHGGVGVHAHQKIRRGEVEEAERVGLDDLRQIHNAA